MKALLLALIGFILTSCQDEERIEQRKQSQYDDLVYSVRCGLPETSQTHLLSEGEIHKAWREGRTLRAQDERDAEISRAETLTEKEKQEIFLSGVAQGRSAYQSHGMVTQTTWELDQLPAEPLEHREILRKGFKTGWDDAHHEHMYPNDTTNQ